MSLSTRTRTASSTNWPATHRIVVWKQRGIRIGRWFLPLTGWRNA